MEIYNLKTKPTNHNVQKNRTPTHRSRSPSAPSKLNKVQRLWFWWLHRCWGCRQKISLHRKRCGKCKRFQMLRCLVRCMAEEMLSEVKRWQRLQVELPGWHPETSPDSESTSHSDSEVTESWPLQSSNYRLTSKFLYLCCKNCSFADFAHSILAQIVHSIFLNS